MRRPRAPRASRPLAAVAATALALGVARAAAPELLRVPLENYDQMQFLGALDVGSPPQRFRVIFDTGSSDTWLPETQCVDCAGSHRYDPAKSRSYEPVDELFRLEYGSGNASGRVVLEQLHLGVGEAALTLPRVRMGSAHRTTKRLQHFQADGIVGLGLETLALVTQPSLLHADARLERFSMYINPLPGALPPSQLVLGGADDALPVAHLAAAEPVRWHRFPLVRYPFRRRAHGFWAIRLQQLTVGGTSDGASVQSDAQDAVVACTAAVAIVDSGTSLLLLPRGAFDVAMAAIRRHLHSRHGRQLAEDPLTVSGFVCADCSPAMFPELRFRLATSVEGAEPSTQTLALRGSDYVRCEDARCGPLLDAHALFGPRRASDTPASAVTTHAHGPPPQEDVVVLGVAFLRAYYALFDAPDKSVSFACVGASGCSGGWAPPLHLHSPREAPAAWRLGWRFWSRVYLGLGLLLLGLSAALLWLVLKAPPREARGLLRWLYGDVVASRPQQHEDAPEPEAEPTSPRSAPAGPTPSRRKKSVCFDV